MSELTKGTSIIFNGFSGTVEFIGELEGKEGRIAGIRFDLPVGKNNGHYRGNKIFDCKEDHGIFIKIAKYEAYLKSHQQKYGIGGGDINGQNDIVNIVHLSKKNNSNAFSANQECQTGNTNQNFFDVESDEANDINKGFSKYNGLSLGNNKDFKTQCSINANHNQIMPESVDTTAYTNKPILLGERLSATEPLNKSKEQVYAKKYKDLKHKHELFKIWHNNRLEETKSELERRYEEVRKENRVLESHVQYLQKQNTSKQGFENEITKLKVEVKNALSSIDNLLESQLLYNPYDSDNNKTSLCYDKSVTDKFEAFLTSLENNIDYRKQYDAFIKAINR